MNSKAQMAAVGVLVTLFVGLVVALSLYSGGITENIGRTTLKINVVNQTVTFPANTSTLVLSGQAATDVVITNSSSGAVVPSTNYTVTNYDVSTGSLRTYLTARSSLYNSRSVNVSYTYEPLGYAQEAGSRAMIGLIAIVAVLAIIAVVIKKIYDDGLFDYFK